MQLRDAVDMLRASRLDTLGPMTWADLGCGDGTFTRALAELLAPGSVVHAMDLDRAALRSLPSRHANARIETHVGDFTRQPWPFANLAGVLMANSLHYVRDQPAFIADARARMTPPHRFLFVEYDSDVPNPYVPYPVSLQRLRHLFEIGGTATASSLTLLGRRPSRYQRAALYAAMITA